MKKFLSVVLALVMTMSLVTIAAGAKDFTDSKKVTYTEAVDVISGIKVVDGYTDGSFNPTATLTRGAAAKIICNLLLGPTAANALGVTSAPFKDVPVSNVFAGYIAYCSSQSIINGYGDGTFKPSGTVTGFQFLKMLLGALGYDGTIEGFTGSNWAVNVAKLAITTGLTDGNDGFVGSKAMTREEAALYALNTLKTPMVYYNNKGTEIKTSDGTIVHVGASAAAPVLSAKSTINGTDGYLEFGEQYFTNLTLNTALTDSMGRTANTWTFKGTKIGSYSSKSATLTYTATVKAADMASALKDYSLSSVVISQNGNTAAAAATTASAIAAMTGDGVTVLIYTNNAAVTKVVSVKNYIAKVTAVDKTAGENTYAIQFGTTTTSLKTEVGYGSFVKDDYVVVTPVFTVSNAIDTTKDPASVTAATKVSGTVSYVKGDGTEATVDGTTYTMSDTASTGTSTAYTFSGLVKSTVTVYADANGYVLYGTQGTDVADYIFVVKSWTANDSFGNSVTYVQGVLSDGTIKVYPIVTDDKSGTNTYGDSYVLVSDSTGTAAATKYIDAAAASGALTAKLLAYTLDGSKIKLTAPNGVYVDQIDTTSAYKTSDVKVNIASQSSAYYGSNVQFVLANKTGGDAASSVVNGIQAIAAGATAYVVHTDDKTGTASSTATYVYVYGTTAVAASSMIFVGDNAITGVNANGNTYTGYIDGVKTTITSNAPSANTFYTYSVDSKGVYTLTSTSNGVYTNETVAGVYNNLLTSAETPTPVLNDAKAANATVVDLTDNGITTMDGLKSLVETGATVKVSVVYSSTDNSVSYVYITDAAITPAASASASTITITGMTLSKISSVEYKIAGVTTVAPAASINTTTGVVSGVTVSSGATVKVTVTSIDGYKLVGTCVAGA